MWILGLLGRLLRIGFWTLVAFLHFWLFLPWVLLRPDSDKNLGPDVRKMAVKCLAARVFRLYLQNLGATFIKVGQILSTRPDIVPTYLVSELAELQDHVPPFSFTSARNVIEQDLGVQLDDVFKSFSSTPLASASIAQVHEAELADGTPVAVKVRRPTVVRQMAFDETIITLMARVVSWIPSLDVLAPVETVHEFCSSVRDQLDFKKEAANNRRFQEIFSNDPEIHVPWLCDRLCGDAVLVMELVLGVKDSDVDRLGLDKKRLAQIGMRAILKMIYEHGFVHADLHPGNILFKDDHQVYFIDLGMVGEIDSYHRNGLAATILALARNDGPTAARFMYEGSPHSGIKDYDQYEADVTALVADIHKQSLNELEMSQAIGAVFEILRTHKLRANASFTTINIAMIVVEGLGKKFDPDMDLFKVIQPYLMQVVASAPEMFQRVFTSDSARPQLEP